MYLIEADMMPFLEFESEASITWGEAYLLAVRQPVQSLFQEAFPASRRYDPEQVKGMPC